MIYLEIEDITAVIQEQLMNSSVATLVPSELNENDILTSIEKKAIDYVISYISGRYNHTTIFDETSPIRNGVLTQIIASIVVYRSVRRNAARKVPDDLVDLYKEAKRDLELIQTGAIDLVGCPKLVNEDGTSPTINYGNNTKDEFFI